MNTMIQRLISTGILLLLAAGIQAGPGTDFALDYFNGLRTLEADFVQQVVDSEQNMQQSSEGHMWIQRPGLFRWDYETPYRQQIVADGERLWSYDEDLEQVSVQKVADVLTSTPAMLLSGSRPMEEVFAIEELKSDSTIRRVLLTPKSADSNVTAITLYFDADTLVSMQAFDSFENTTTFSFFNLERNGDIDPQRFRFSPPANTDVIGDAG